MTRSYALYFDAPRRNAERLVKRGLLAAIFVLHLFVVGILLRENPALIQASTSLIVVELNALSHSAATSANHKRMDAAANSSTKHSGSPPQRAHASSAVHTPVAEGSIAVDTGRDLVTTTSIGSANAIGAGTQLSGGASSTDTGHGSRFRPPAVKHRWNPLYPWIAYQGGIEGVADVLVTIGADGSLLDARIDHSSGNNALDAATLDAIRHYTFRPGMKDGDAIEAQAIVSIEWRIEPGIKVEAHPMRVRDMHQTIDRTARLIPNLPVRD